MITTDPGTPGDKRWEINVGVSVEKRNSAIQYEVPVVNANYGVGEHLQLSYEVPWIVLKPEREIAKSGLGNSNIGVKWRFLDEARQGISMSTEPAFEFNNPTSSADRGLVDSGSAFRLPLEMERELGPVTANLEFGRVFKQRESNEWIYGAVLRRKVVESLELLAEIHGAGRPNFRKHETVLNLGAIWDIGRRYSALLSAGRSFQSSASDAPTMLLYIGMQMRL